MPNPIACASPVSPIRSAPAAARGPLARIAAVTLLTGAGAGLGGMLLALLLHAIQHLAYGYDVARAIGDEGFLEGVTAASPLRRFIVLTGCGVLAGGGWWALYRFGAPLVGIRRAVRAENPRMPVASTTAHALLQIAPSRSVRRSAARSRRARSVRCGPAGSRIARGCRWPTHG